ncbi:unnamed protein product, partial [Vitis vinifera]
MLGAPDQPLELPAFPLILGRKTVGGSLTDIGNTLGLKPSLTIVFNNNIIFFRTKKLKNSLIISLCFFSIFIIRK